MSNSRNLQDGTFVPEPSPPAAGSPGEPTGATPSVAHLDLTGGAAGAFQRPALADVRQDPGQPGGSSPLGAGMIGEVSAPGPSAQLLDGLSGRADANSVSGGFLRGGIAAGRAADSPGNA